MSEKRVFIVLCIVLAFSVGLAWYISSSATHTLTIF